MRIPGKLLAQVIMVVSIVGLGVLGILFGIEEYLIRTNQTNRAITFFPYFPVHQPVFLDPKHPLSEAARQKLNAVYEYSPDYYHYLISTGPVEQRSELIEHLYTLDPWQRVYQDPTAYYLEQHDWEKVEQLLTDLVTFLRWGFAERQYSREEILYKQKANWARQLLALADHQAETDRITEAAKTTKAAQYFDEWVLTHVPLLPLKLTEWDQRERFLTETVSIKPTYWGDYREDLANMWLEIILGHLQAEDWTTAQLTTATHYLLGLAEMRTNLLWERATTQELPTIREALVGNDLNKAMKHLDQLLTLWQNFNAYSYQYPPYRDEVNAIRVTEVAEAYEEVVRQAPAAQRYDLLTQLDTVMRLRPSWKERIAEEYVPFLQQAADKALAEKQPEHTEAILKQMQALVPYDYWVSTQLGNFYMTTHQHDKAVEAFITCRNQLDYYHVECENALQDLTGNEINDQRYYQVSKIVQKKNVWQDFME